MAPGQEQLEDLAGCPAAVRFGSDSGPAGGTVTARLDGALTMAASPAAGGSACPAG